MTKPTYCSDFYSSSERAYTITEPGILLRYKSNYAYMRYNDSMIYYYTLPISIKQLPVNEELLLL